MMEPERPKVDRSILEFVKSRKFHAADFVIRSDGVCRLNPEMARQVAQEVGEHLMSALHLRYIASQDRRAKHDQIEQRETSRDRGFDVGQQSSLVLLVGVSFPGEEWDRQILFELH